MATTLLDGYYAYPHHTWLTWVGSTTASLKGLGINCDTVDVGGLSGYAFVLNIERKGICPSGPTAFDWNTLLPGIRALGAEPTAHWQPAGEREHELRVLFDLAKAEIDAGRPVVLWGTHCPEFGVATGYRDDEYVLCSFKSNEEPRTRFDSLQTPGGIYGLFLRPAPKLDRGVAEVAALRQAVMWVRGEDASAAGSYAQGLPAYDAWINCIKRGQADEFGHSYNLACWQEGRRLAGEWLARIAPNHPAATTFLREAADTYKQAAESLAIACRITPFPNGGVNEPEKARQVIDLLRAAAAAEACALSNMESGLEHL